MNVRLDDRAVALCVQSVDSDKTRGDGSVLCLSDPRGGIGWCASWNFIDAWITHASGEDQRLWAHVCVPIKSVAV